jgi:hypothetical protein
VPSGVQWVTQKTKDDLQAAIVTAKAALTSTSQSVVDTAATTLASQIEIFKNARQAGTAAQVNKTITISGLTSFNGSQIQLGLFESADIDITEEPQISGYGTIQNNTVTISLYNTSNSSAWGGIGSFYVGFMIGTDMYISKAAVSFTATVANVATNFSDYKEYVPVFSYIFGEIAEEMGIEIPAGGMTLDALFQLMMEMTYAQMIEAGYTGQLYKDEALTQPFSGSDVLTAATVIYSASPIGGGEPPVEPVTPVDPVSLTAGTWVDGEIVNGGDVDWYSINVTSGSTYYLWWNDSYDGDDTKTLDIDVYAYNNSGNPVSLADNDKAWINPVSFTASSSGTVYVRVRAYGLSDLTGTYAIVYNTSNNKPVTGDPGSKWNPISLAVNTWVDGSLASDGEQWFKFTATSSTQYIHVSFGTLTGLSAQVYESNGTTTVGSSQLLLSSTSSNFSRALISGQEYYIKVTPPSNTYSGTYKIWLSTSDTAPPVTLPSDAIKLDADVWTDGSLTSGGEQWFKFTATDSTQYIHANFGTLSSILGLYFQVYDSVGGAVGNRTNLSSSNKYASRTLISGQEYYIKVTPYSSSGIGGTYKIMFSMSTTTPLPSDAIPLTTANVWVNGNLPANGEQWFKFTATNSTQYIHASFSGALTNMTLQLYDSSNTTVGSPATINSSSANKYTSQTLISGQEYYIKVTTTSSSGTYKIAFNTVSRAPDAKDITQFSFGDFSVDGEIGGLTGTNITVYVPNIVNLTTLAPTITHSGKSISPASGTAQNFTNPVQYTVTAEDNTTKTYTVIVWPDSYSLATAFAWINSNAISSRTYTIVVENSTSLAPTTINKSNVNIILSGGTSEKTISLSSNGSLFTVSSGTLTLENNITLAGLTANNASLVKVNNSGSLVMKTGSKIQNNTVTIDSSTSSSNVAAGGGVYISGSFTMDGGTISGNRVEATNSSSSSYNNTIKALGGGVYFYSGTFTMNNGTISNNTAYSNKYATAGGGVYVDTYITFTMNGGTISNNTAESSSVLATSNTYGGGVAVWDNSTFTMKGGTISGNIVKTASNCLGGGVYSTGSSFTKTGGTIYGSNATPSTLQNTAKNTNSGHAVYVYISSTVNRKRNTTATTSDNMNSSTTGSSGGWE